MWISDLVVGVLAELVAVGIAGAGAVLLDHVARGEQWDDAIREISQSPGDPYRQIPAALEGRFTEDECEAIVNRARAAMKWWRMRDTIDKHRLCMPSSAAAAGFSGPAGHPYVKSATWAWQGRVRRRLP